MPRSEIRRYESLLTDIKEEFPEFRLIYKRESSFQKWIHNGLCLLTMGKMTTYLDKYHTTLGQRIYVPERWKSMSDNARYVVLCHERIHMRQFRRYSFAGMAFLYLLVPLPVGFAFFRARFERQAYAESMRADAEVYGITKVRDQAYREHILEQFMGPSYLWMWPFRNSLARWYERALQLAEDSI